MSRTWRKVPRQPGKPATTAHNGRKGGTIASKGPSPERRRPPADCAETLHLAAALLEYAATRTTQPETLPINPMAAGTRPSVAQTLWLVAADGDCPAELLLPAMQVAKQAIRQVADGEPDPAPSPELFAKASTLLNAMTNTGGQNHASSAKDEIVPDGRQRYTHIPYWRDNRATGLRAADHRRARREAKQGLADPEHAETVRAGKIRRYTDTHGNYEF